MNKLISTAVIAAIATTWIFKAELVNAATTTGTATQVVTTAISITNVSDLDFGSAPQGDASKQVLPGSSENTENGSFTVSGQANTAYTITLPANGVVIMETAGGGTADKQIAVDSFASFPAAGANGLLSGAGSQSLFVGGTRAALLSTQVAGSYTGTYQVIVVY